MRCPILKIRNFVTTILFAGVILCCNPISSEDLFENPEKLEKIYLKCIHSENTDTLDENCKNIIEMWTKFEIHLRKTISEPGEIGLAIMTAQIALAELEKLHQKLMREGNQSKEIERIQKEMMTHQHTIKKHFAVLRYIHFKTKKL